MNTILKFVKNHGPYTPGDVAGFSEVAAQEYVASGVAEVAAPSPEADIAPVATDAADVGDTVQATPAARRGRRAKS